MSDNKIPETLEELYAGNDIESLFPGGFINFGYYKGLNINELDVNARITSQKNLYSLIHKTLGIKDGDSVLEVGIGYGGGPAWTAENFKLKKMIGIDIFIDHVNKATENFSKNLAKTPYLSYLNRIAENMQFDSNTFDKVYIASPT